MKVDQTKKLDSIAKTLSEVASANKNLGAELLKLFHGSRQKLLAPASLERLSWGIKKLDLTKNDIAALAKEQAVLKSLNFSSRPVRHDNIPLAYEKHVSLDVGTATTGH